MNRFRILTMSTLSLGCVAWYRPVYPVMISGPSMNPTFHDGQVVFAAAVNRPLQRGDVVIVNHGVDKLIKRIAFLGGDSFVQVDFPGSSWFTPCSGGSVKSLALHHVPYRRTTIPLGTVYVVGDNFANSTDSTSFGPVPESSVVGLLVDQPRPKAGPSFLAPHFLGSTGWAEAFYSQGNKP